jgi:hypothetical protein
VITDQDRAAAGAAYLTTRQRANGSIPAFSPIGSTADAVLALVAAGGEGPTRRAALAYLRAQVRKGNVDTVGLVAKVVQAAAAAGKDPSSFGGQDLVRWLRSRIKESGKIGAATVFDQALAILALEASGATPRRSTTDWLLGAQCPVGGWSFDTPYRPSRDDESCFDGSKDDFFTADTNTTSYAVMALEYVGRNGYAEDPFAFFQDARDAVHGGWEYAPGFGTDANSTALVIQSYAAAGLGIPSGGLNALRDLQPDVGLGAWAYAYVGDAPGDPDVGATIGAIPAILQTPLPLTSSPGRTA